MREIKFRAWDMDKAAMRHVSLIEFDGAGEICNVALLAQSQKTKSGSSDRFEERENGEDLVLMQFTGLKDKNGKEIFEGDILQFKSMFGNEKPSVAFIDWFERDADYWLYYNLERDSFTGIVNLFHGNEVMALVIGNIYENPELLSNHQTT